MKQLLDQFFTDCKKQDFRHALINQIPADPRVKRLLIALDEVAHWQGAEVLADGTTQVSPTMDVIRHYLTPKPKPNEPPPSRPARNTVRDWIDLATSTPYLIVDGKDNCAHIYLIQWKLIFQASENPVGGCNEVGTAMPASNVFPSTPAGQRGGQRGGQRAGQRGGQSTIDPRQADPLLTPSKTQKPRTGVLDINTQQTQNGGAGGIDPGQSLKRKKQGEIPRTFRGTKSEWFAAITQWRRFVFARNLVDPDDVEELYGLAVGLGLLQPSEQNRFRVYCQAAHDTAHARIRGAIFKENVAFNDWKADLRDEDLARLMMKRVDAPLLVEPDREHPYAFVEDSTATSRQEAEAGLAKFVASRSNP